VQTCPQCGTEYQDDAAFCALDQTPLSPTATPDDLIGTIVADRYRILRLLGAGGMGRVYLAEHVLIGRMSAVKVMSAGMADDPDAQKRFTREAANASRINHPNVCAVHDFGPTESGAVYLAMEYIEGETLRIILERERVLSPDRAFNLLQQCTSGLDAAHQLGIVHRDLKPDNIMVVPGPEETAKIVDFGVARAFGSDAEGQRVTRTGLVVGTPEYMSPEQLAGDAVDSRTDVYALAMILYRALTGVHPFEANSAQATLSRRLTEDPAPLAEIRPDLAFPEGLQDVLFRALSRDRDGRYGTAGEFSKALESAGSSPVDAIKARPTHDVAADETVVLDQGPSEGPGGRRMPMGPVITVMMVAAVAISVVYALRGPLLGISGQNEGVAAPAPIQGSDTLTANQDGSPSIQPSGAEGGEPGAGGSEVPTAPPAQATADLAAIQAELIALQDSIIAFQGRRGDFRRRAEAIFGDRNLPDSLRVTAAWTVAQAHKEEAEDSNALTWYRTALDLVPLENTARRARLLEIISQLEPQSP
jgi:serine/threonine-protein kinase